MTGTAAKDLRGARGDSRKGFSSAMAIAGYALTWLIALLLISEYGLRFASYWHHRHDAAIVASRQAYDRAFWVSQLAKDHVEYLKSRGAYSGAYSYAPFTVVDSESFHSQYVNVDSTVLGALRHSRAATCSPPTLRVWAFGGSATFGVGVPDDMTWPSALVEELRKLTGKCVEVENFGVETMSTNQELIRLIQALKTGVKPDLVVFFDGANDSSFGTGIPGPQAYGYYDVDKPLMDQRHTLTGSLQNLKLVQYLRRALHRAGSGQAIEIQGEMHRFGWGDQELRERAKRTIDNYLANVEAVRALADAYHFRAYFFWQPVSFYGNSSAVCGESQMLIENNDQLRGRKAVTETYEEAEHRAAAAGFVSLAHLFDETKTCVFLDPVHLGPAGNRMVATKIASQIAVGEREAGR